MHFTPTPSEVSDLSDMGAPERLQYFLSRTIETEEVWGLSDAAGWILREADEQAILQVWPYAQLACDYASAHDETYQPDATSLEHFVHNLLGNMMEQEIGIEILPVKQQAGIIIAAGNLHELFSGMLESGEYYLEG